MNYKKLFILLLYFTASSSVLFSQSKFFVKYKNSVAVNTVEQKVAKQNLLQNANTGLQKISSAKLAFFAKGLGKSDDNLSRILTVSFNTTVTLDTFKEMLSNDPDVEYVQESHTYKIEYTPNDSLISKQWGLQKINAYQAWDITLGSDTVVVGILDTGIDYLHPDLKNKIFLNKGETGTDANGKDKRFNGIDDDGDGFIDDYMGWDFVDKQGFPFDSLSGDYLTWDNNPLDENGHGTNLAGVVAAETNNTSGIAGTAPNLKIMNIRAFDLTGNGEEDDVAAGILYAVRMGVKVINMSFGDTQFSYVLRDVIRYAYSRNVVLVASSGNSTSDVPHYPSGYPEVICVGASTNDDVVAGFSNFGSTLDLVAPGQDILTTGLKNPYEYVSGTSLSTPFVSAAAGLILSLKNFSNEEVRQILKSTADDIDKQGWDTKSGAGRLNLYKALSSLTPAKVKIEYPSQDFSTNADTLNIMATIQSPYFQKYSLQYGFGITPASWIVLSTGNYQIPKQSIYTMDISGMPDTVYTLRLLMYENNGNTQEERINFYIMRSAPAIDLINVGTLYTGDRSTIFAELVTNQRCITRMYYRKANTGQFNFITLDGFATNNQFVKYNHYGFVPKQLVDANTDYEVYFEAENLAGLKTILKNGAAYYTCRTAPYFSISQVNEMPFSLPKGTMFQNPVSFLSTKFNEVLFTQNYELADTAKSFLSYCLYKLENNKFVKVATDSLLNKIPRFYGDFNKNGKNDIISSMVKSGFYDEQKESGSFYLKNIYTDSTANRFFPVAAQDIDGDGNTEIISLKGDNSFYIWKIKNNVITLQDSLSDFSFQDPYSDYPNVLMRNFAVADLNNDGIKEIWFVDRDGDIMYYTVNGSGQYQQGSVIQTKNESDYNNIISVGDFDGDGITDMAVLLQSSDAYSIGHYHRLIVFNMKNNNLNILTQQFFLDQSTEFKSNAFNRTVNNTIKFVDVDNDKKDELVISTFPYTYILKYSNAENKFIFYKEGGNSYSIFAGDLNQNGVNEIALETADGVKFYEFTNSDQPVTPNQFEGYSTASSAVYLKWNGDGTKYYIYRGLSADQINLIDSTANAYYTDNSTLVNTDYYYQIKSYDPSKKVNYSALSDVKMVHSHTPAKLTKAVSSSSKCVEVFFSDRVNNTIENLQAFSVINFGTPNSVSASSQNSYLLTYNKDFPYGNNKLSVTGLKDFYGSPISADTVVFKTDSSATAQEFYITAFQIIDRFQVRIDFNLPVDETSALNSANYSFQPDNKIGKITLANNNYSIFIFLDGKKPVGSIGREYRLKLDNLISSQASGSVKINKETGSYVILTGNAKDLSDVYAYPNPARVLNGEGKVTFANLPRRAKILILTISGEQVSSLYEFDGNGGADFNLRNKKGELLGSGIYIYRVVMLDDYDNEVETKIGKFAVIR